MTACLEQDRAEGNAPRSGAAKGISEPCSRRRTGKRAASALAIVFDRFYPGAVREVVEIEVGDVVSG
jgi:hypothetical protein